MGLSLFGSTVCMCVCVCVCMYVCACVCVHVCACVCMSVCAPDMLWDKGGCVCMHGGDCAQLHWTGVLIYLFLPPDGD